MFYELNWIVFVVWLETAERRLALFPAGTITREPEFRLSWMKLCISDKHYTNSNFFPFFSNSNLFSFFFFNFSIKRKLDFIHFHCVFSISILFPAFPPRFPAFPPLFPSFPPWFPGFSLWLPVFQPTFSTFPPLFYFLHSHPHSPHFPHSVLRFLIPAFTDSHNILCIKITWAI